MTKKNKVKVSCVIPSWNRVHFLAECIESLRKQKGFKDGELEIIVVDDASTDTTSDLMKYYAEIDDNIKYILNASNQGAGISRNEGNMSARGEIICVCDSDDFYPNYRCKVSYDYLKSHPEADIITGSYTRVSYHNQIEEEFTARQMTAKTKKEDIYFSHPTCAYRTKDIIKLPYKRDIKDKTPTDDFMMLMDWLKAGKKLKAIKKLMCFHRVLPGSIMYHKRGQSLD